jgi:hemerythrin-like domain-containing protein
MQPTSILSNEHRVIEIMLSVLENLADKTIAEKKLERQTAEEVIDFIRNFADRCHHGKEENHLFVALVDKGIPKEGGPVGQMLLEHDQGREYVRGMANNIDAAEKGNEKSIREFVGNAFGYVELLRSHIHKEDNILFPMAERFLDENDKTNLLGKFEKVESEHMGYGIHDKYMKIAENLARSFNIPFQYPKNMACGHARK